MSKRDEDKIKLKATHSKTLEAVRRKKTVIDTADAKQKGEQMGMQGKSFLVYCEIRFIY